MRQGYDDRLDYERSVWIVVDFTTERRQVLDYAVVLTVAGAIVRVYDGAHGVNEMHRYTSIGDKTTAEVFHLGTLGEGMRFAIGAVRDGYEEMIEAWRAR